PSHPTPPNRLVTEATEGLHFPLPGRPVGQPPFPSPSRPHPRVQRGRGLPHAAASASSPRGSWCLPGPTGLTRTTQPQDVRSDGTTASCHAPPLPPPPASSPPRISPPTPPSRAQDESKAEGGRFPPHDTGRADLCQPLSPFRNSTFLLNRSEVGLGGRGPEAGHGLGGKGRRPAETLRLREASRTGRRPWQEVSEWLRLLPFLGVLALLGYLAVRPFLPKKKQQKDSLINLKIQKENPKVVNEINIEDLCLTKAAYCRCWRSKTFPACDGSHNKHNELTGDNVGPLILKKKEV
uniref:CDGSH iron-sulfur domain-containing protein 2 n=1 Tax=Capra hircus TaxID=9925 RepID=A0A8C2NSM8_CAPHI